MKSITILTMEWLITGFIVYAGLSDKQKLFIKGPRSAVTTLGAIGFAMCMIIPTIGIFIRNAPTRSLTIFGCILGAIALFTTVMQIFRWNIPIIHDPKIANAIAKQVGGSAKSICEAVHGEVDILFLGTGLYAFDIDLELKEYISTLNLGNIKMVVVFSTSAIVKSAYEKTKNTFKTNSLLYQKKNIIVQAII